MVERTTIRQNVWMGTATIATTSLSFVSYGCAVKVLPLADAGVIGVISSVAGAVNVIGSGAVGPTLINSIKATGGGFRVAADKIRAALSYAILVGVAIAVAILVGYERLLKSLSYVCSDSSVIIYIALSGLTIVLIQIININRALVHSKDLLQQSSKIDIEYALVTTILTAGGLALFPNITVVALASVGAALFQLTRYIILVRQIYGTVVLPGRSFSHLVAAWNSSRWNQLGGIFGLIGDTLDKIIIGAFFGAANVPPYLFARRIYSQSNSLLASQTYHIFTSGPTKTSVSNFEDCEPNRDQTTGGLIALAASWLYLSIYCLSPIILKIVGKKDFLNLLHELLVIFCLIGWLQATTLVTYFQKLRSGSFWTLTVTNAIAGPGALVSMIILGSRGSILLCAAGQFTIAFGLIWLLSLNNDDKIEFRLLVRRLLIALPSGLLALSLATSITVIASRFNDQNHLYLAGAIVISLFYVPLALRLPKFLPNQENLRTSVQNLIQQLPIVEVLREPIRRIAGVSAPSEKT